MELQQIVLLLIGLVAVVVIFRVLAGILRFIVSLAVIALVLYIALQLLG